MPVQAPVVLGPAVSVSSPVPMAAVQQTGIEHLLAVSVRVGLHRVEVIASVAAIDAECAVFKIRQITERLCAKILAAKGQRKLDAMITEIEQKKMLSEKGIRNLRYIKETANQAVHNTDAVEEEEFTIGDVNLAAGSLATVLEAAIKARRIAVRT